MDLSEVDRALCNMAWDLTITPHADNKSAINRLRKMGLNDRALLDAVLVVSYFNFVNRIVLGLGLDVNEDELKGYLYE